MCGAPASILLQPLAMHSVRATLFLYSALVLPVFVSYTYAANNGLAITPQMGWNTWNHFGCGISQDTIVNAAKALISNGLDKLGYECEFDFAATIGFGCLIANAPVCCTRRRPRRRL